MIEDTCGIHFPQEWKSRLKNFVAAVLFEFNGLVQKTTLFQIPCIFQDQFTVLGNFLDKTSSGLRTSPDQGSQCLDCHRAELAKKTLNQLKPEESLYASTAAWQRKL